MVQTVNTVVVRCGSTVCETWSSFVLTDKARLRKIIILTMYFLIIFFLKVVNMVDFQYHGSDDLQDAAFSWLEMGCYWQAFDGFQELISRTKFKLNHVQGDQFNETLCILGKLRRGLAEALWHMNGSQNALKQIQLCISENCHEFSEVSENSSVISKQ